MLHASVQATALARHLASRGEHDDADVQFRRALELQPLDKSRVWIGAAVALVMMDYCAVPFIIMDGLPCHAVHCHG